MRLTGARPILAAGMTISSDRLITTKQQAVQFYRDGRLTDALQACSTICEEGGNDPVVFCLMGVIYGQLNQYRKSAEYSRRAIDLYPEYLDAHYNYALASRQLGGVEQSIASLEFVVARKPHDPEVHYSLGFALEWSGDYDRALAEYRIAQSLRADYLDACAGEASVLQKLGDFDAAWRIVRPHVENAALNNGMMAAVYGTLAQVRGDSGAALTCIEQYSRQSALSEDDRLLLHFTLASLCDRLGRYDQAFDHYRQANAMKGVCFDAAGFRYRVDGIIAEFSEYRLERPERSEMTLDRPVFIVGMMRSGTSLVEQILASHSAVFGAGELPDMQRIAAAVRAAEPEVTRLTAQQLNAYAGRYLDRISRLNDEARRVVDKMPQNFLHLGYIALLFPNARIIHCTRHALDTCLSCYFQNFAAYQAHTFDLEALGHYYIEYLRLMSHWHEVLDLPLCEVRYEDLVCNPQEEIGRILAFCGLEPEPGCFDFHQSRRAVGTASFGQVRRPMYGSSVERWRNYEKHIGPLASIVGR